jgi:hypothetical protein
MSKSPSIIRILLVDYAVFVCAMAPIVFWSMYFIFNGKPGKLDLPVLFGLLSIVCIMIVFWRILMINSIFNDDQQVNSIITKIYFYRDRGRIEYTYEYLGQKYSSGNAVMNCKWTKVFTIGQSVVVMVDRNHPRRAFMRDLYSDGK